MIPWFVVAFIRAFCSLFGIRVYALAKFGGWGAMAIRFHRVGSVDPSVEVELASLADRQATLPGLGRPSGWARSRRRPAIG